MDTTPQSLGDFVSTGLKPETLAALAKLGITIPTPIQAQSIPVALTGKDIMGIAETGTGKTYAFSLPIIEKLLTGNGKALIIVPTRELALQVEQNIKDVTKLMPLGLRSVCLIGGAPIYRQKQDLRLNPRIVVGTPGRIWDHMTQRTLILDNVVAVVLDEADRMLDMGFAPQIKRIMETTPVKRQTFCFSATMAPEMSRLSSAYLKDPVRIQVSNPGASKLHIKQEMAFVRHGDKPAVLNKILEDHEGKVIVFSRTKHGARKLAEIVRDSGHSATEIHSNRSLGQRRHSLEGFKDGRYRVLVATDVAARGIDVNNIELVVNYDLPDASEDYVHRIGRTGRAGKDGKAISMATRDQSRLVQSIERLTKQPIPASEYSDAAAAAPKFERAPQGTYQPRQWTPSAPRTGGGSGYNSSRPSYGAPRTGGNDRPAYGALRPARSDDRPNYGAPRPTGDRPAYGSSSAPRSNDRPSYGAPRPQGDRPARPSYGAPRSGGNDRPSYGAPRPTDSRDSRGDRSTGGTQGRFQSTTRPSAGRSFGTDGAFSFNGPKSSGGAKRRR